MQEGEENDVEPDEASTGDDPPKPVKPAHPHPVIARRTPLVVTIKAAKGGGAHWVLQHRAFGFLATGWVHQGRKATVHKIAKTYVDTIYKTDCEVEVEDERERK